MHWRCSWFVLAVAMFAAPSLRAETVTFSGPSLDRWSYPFAGNGAEEEARLFSALGTPDFDERDSQFIVAFDTTADGSSAIPAGLGAGNYQIQSVKLTATVSSLVGTPTYDGSHDAYTTYLPVDATEYVADADAGRPIELFGAGFRGGYSRFGFEPTDGAPPAFEENNAFGFGPPTGRYVHPVAFDGAGNPLNASNNIDYLNGGAAAFEANPFAVGVTPLADGAALAVGTEFTFDVNVTDPYILSYLQDGLDDGQLGFVLSTLALSDSFPRLYTKEFQGGFPVSLEIEYSAVPEPSSLVLAGGLLGGVAVLRAWRRRSA
jgi:hypothetical protein